MVRFAEEMKIYAKYLSVLVVEDDEDINNIFSSILRESFMSVDSALNGEEAYKKFLKNNYDIIITDIFMKKIDGVELTKKIKEINRDQLIIAISAYDDSEILIKLINYGINGFLKKPINIEEFLKVVLREVKVSIQRKERSLLKYRYLKKHLNKVKNDNVIKKLDRTYDLTENQENKIETEPKLPKKSEIVNTNPISEKIKTIQEIERKNIAINESLKQFLLEESDKVIKVNEDFQSVMNEMLLYDLNQDLIYDIAEIFSKYYSVLSQIPELDNVSFYFVEISDIFGNLVFSELSQSEKSTISNIDYIADDIKNLLIEIFVNNDINKITFLKQILQGYYEQIQLDLGLIDEAEDDNDIYFF